MFKSIKENYGLLQRCTLKCRTSMAQYFLIAQCANFSLKKDTAQHHQLALGLSVEWSLLGDGWIPPLFWFSGPSLHDGALSPRSVPGGSWERESPARLRQPSLWSSGHRRCHSGLDTSTSDLQIGHGPPAIASLSEHLPFVHISFGQPIISGVPRRLAIHHFKAMLENIFFLQKFTELITLNHNVMLQHSRASVSSLFT